MQTHALRWLMLLILPAFSAFAEGIRLNDQDAFATGRGNAFAATADNPSALYYNPAASRSFPATSSALVLMD